MRKGLSILLILLMLSAMLHLTLATHYCGGRLASSKVSLTGKLANCGMEDSKKELPLPGTNFTQHCCDDAVIFCGTDNNYIPSFSCSPESCQYNFQVFAVSGRYSVNSFLSFKILCTDISPPGELMSTDVDLSEVCVFRI
jgi:hypothetical protein